MSSVRATAATAALALTAAAATLAQPARADWTTYHADSPRTGVDASSGASVPFAAAWTTPSLGGNMWAEPLVYQGLVIVATGNDDVIALNESNGQVAWRAHAGTPVPASALPCGDVSPTVGITSTPVIDPSTGDLYAVADLWDGSHAQHVLVAYNARTGAELFRRGANPSGATPESQLQRIGLGLDGGRVLIGYGGNSGDCASYWGFLVSVPANNLGASSQWKAPTSKGDAIWAGGAAPAIDSAGAAYAATGNGASSSTSNFDYGDTVVKFDASANQLDYFAPSSWAADSAADADLGSTSPELLSNGLAYQGGKNGNGYLINTQGLGHVGGQLYMAPVCDSYGGDSFAQNTIYVACSGGVQALSLDTVNKRFAALWHGPSDANGPPIVAGGLVWATSTSNSKLYGLDPATGATRVTQSTPAMEHFATPAASDGKLFLATDQTVEAYTIAVAVTPPAAGNPPGSAPPGSSPAPGTTISPPSASHKATGACPTRLTFGLVVPRHSAVKRVRVLYGRRKVADRRGRHLKKVSFAAPAKTFTLHVTETLKTGRHIRFRVTFRNCRRVRVRRR